MSNDQLDVYIYSIYTNKIDLTFFPSKQFCWLNVSLFLQICVLFRILLFINNNTNKYSTNDGSYTLNDIYINIYNL